MKKKIVIRILLFVFASFVFQSFVTSEAYSNKNQQPEILYSAPVGLKSNRENIKLLSQATFNLPKNFDYIATNVVPKDHLSFDEGAIEGRLGIIRPKDDDYDITISFVKSGYVIDDGAQSKFKIQKGKLESLDEPRYDPVLHKVYYSTVQYLPDPTVNYVAIFFGKEGYFVFNLITPLPLVKNNMKKAEDIFASFHFVNGKTYEDFDASIDLIAPYDVRSVMDEIRQMVTGVPTDSSNKFSISDFMIKTLMFTLKLLVPITVWFFSIFILTGKLRLRKWVKTALKIPQTHLLLTNSALERSMKKFSLISILREMWIVIKIYKYKYLIIWLYMILLMITLSFIAVSLNLPKYIYYLLTFAAYFPFYVATVRLTAYGRYESFLYAFPAVNLRVLRALGWTLFKSFLISFPLILAVLCYFAAMKSHLISPLLSLVLVFCLGVIALYIWLRLLVASVAVCFDIPNPIKFCWDSTKSNVIKMLFVLLFASVFCLLMGGIGFVSVGAMPEKPFNPFVISEPVSNIRTLFLISIFVSVQVVIYILYAVTGIKAFGIRNETTTK